MTTQSLLQDVADRHGFSPAAVEAAWSALSYSGGGIAQFGHPELGGMGQWMPGMLMIGDMFNNHLKGRVDGLFSELSRRYGEIVAASAPPPPPVSHGVMHAPPPGSGDPSAARAAPVIAQAPASSFSYSFGQAPITSWYPADLGLPATSGSQNNFRWAFFPITHRLAVQLDADLRVYDTADLEIGGVSQQQDSAGGRITFTSQRGTVDLASLTRVI